MPIESPHPILARRRRLVAFAAASALVALIAATAAVFKIGLLPPTIESRQLQQGAAVTHAAIQLPPADRPFTPTAFETQAKRANLIGNLMATSAVLDRVGRLTGIDPGEIAAASDVNQSVPAAFNEANGERRASQILASDDRYRLDIQARPAEPMLDVYAQAPTVALAKALADASVTAANEYLHRLAREHNVAGRAPVTLKQLGPARGGSLDPTAPLKIGALTFLVIFAVTFGLLFLLGQIRRGWLRAGRVPESPYPVAEVDSEPVGRTARLRDDWPHTSRVLPWTIAAFIALLWLVPINAITVQASLPVDLKLDRLALPLIVLIWLLSLATGGSDAPRWRFTTIHAAIALFVAVAFLSVVLNATDLNQTLELEVAVKKLTLLAAFFSIFLVVASTIRPTEVRPFMTFMLVLASISALGILWEYQFETNLFYRWSAQLLPGFFQVTAVDTTGYDEIGRRAVIGSADLSLEAVAMLSMALPIAVVRLMHSTRARERLLCGLAICLLLGAMIATYRKSALLAPVTVLLILGYFRRRELLRLAPIGVVILVALPLLAPNALGSIIDQFAPNRLGVATVSDRVSDYDAIRPDVLSHLAFGQGFGSYEHTNHRILDNDLMLRLVETGLIGLIAFVFMLVLVIATAAPIIRGRDPARAPPALAVAAAAGAFLVLSALFDVMSFPHTPYILMVLFGLLAVIVAAPKNDRPDHEQPPPSMALGDVPPTGLGAESKATVSAPF